MPQIRPVNSGATHVNKGQATVEFALLLPLLVMCLVALLVVLTACLSTLRLQDYAHIAARTAATSADTESVKRDFSVQCRCDLVITTEADIVSVRAEQAFSVPLLGIALPVIRLHAESLAMQEPPIVFAASTE